MGGVILYAEKIGAWSLASSIDGPWGIRIERGSSIGQSSGLTI